MTDPAWLELLGDLASGLIGIGRDVDHELTAGGLTPAQQAELQRVRDDVNGLLDRWRERWRSQA